VPSAHDRLIAPEQRAWERSQNIIRSQQVRDPFLRKLAEEKGVHYAREASGHQSDRYIWRCVKPDQQTLADAIDELE
jgi:hypothetical protein